MYLSNLTQFLKWGLKFYKRNRSNEKDRSCGYKKNDKIRKNAHDKIGK